MLSCPCCNATCEHFKPFGLTPRPNAMCPCCGALERHRLLWLYFRDRTRLFDGPPLAVLHVAPESVFRDAFRRLPHLAYVSAGLESPPADERIDIMDIPRPMATFDVIICNHVLEHVADDRRAMRELHRVLKPGGWAVLQSPMDSRLPVTLEDPSVTDPVERKRLFGQRDHVRLYGRDYGDRLRGAGFTVTRDRFFTDLSDEVVRRHALLDEDIYVCGKPNGEPPAASGAAGG